jgi:hypothetical protein
MLGAGAVQAAGDPDVVLPKGPNEVDVLTLNQYFGADLTPILTASAADFNAALLQVLKQAAANNAPARIQRQADEITERLPDLIGLQEVLHTECRDLPPLTGACAEPSIAKAVNVDYLNLTLQALPDYEAAARVENFGFRDITVIGSLPGVPFTIVDNNGASKNGLLSSYEQDVILVRKGATAVEPVFLCDIRRSALGCNYSAADVVKIAGRDFTIKRGYVAVNATVRNRPYRFVNTHLEPSDSEVQAEQAAELRGALNTSTPADRSLILVGDFNSPPTDVAPESPYNQFVGAGYVDVWTARHGSAPGFTCCQDADLRNAPSKLSRRIDLIFTKAQPVLGKQALVVLDDLNDRTPPGPGQPRLWPSDHAGVEALLNFSGSIPSRSISASAPRPRAP